MKSPETTSAPVERLYSLTLLVNEAIDKDASQDLVTLLEQRGQLMDSLEPCKLGEQDRRVLQDVFDLGAQMEAKLLERKSESLARLQDIANTKSGIRSYQKQL